MRNGDFGRLETLLVDYVFFGGQGEPDWRGIFVLVFFVVAASEEVALGCWVIATSQELGSWVWIAGALDLLDQSAGGFQYLEVVSMACAEFECWKYGPVLN